MTVTVTSKQQQKKHNFDPLIKRTPFSEVLYGIKAKEKLKMEILQSALKEPSTKAFSRKMDASSRSESPLNEKKAVTFCDEYSPSKKMTRSILKIGEKSKFSQYLPETFMQAEQQDLSRIPRWGRDWDEIERRITIIEANRARRRGAVLSDRFDHLKTIKSPKMKKKQSYFKKKISKVVYCIFGSKEDTIKDQSERDYYW